MTKQGHQSTRCFLALILLTLYICGCGQSQEHKIPSEVSDNFIGQDSNLSDFPPVGGGATPTSTDTEEFVNDNIFNPSSRVDLRLPGYSYFQGIVQAETHLLVTGQIRIVGGILGAGDGSTTSTPGTVTLYRGAMVTSNPEAFLGAGTSLTNGPAGITTRISKWEEIPTP